MHTAVVLVALPFVAVVAALLFVDRRERLRTDVIARQIALTDAVHCELGAMVAPFVERNRWGRWQIAIAVPFSQLEIVPALMMMARQAVPESAQRSVRIVFTPQAETRPRALPAVQRSTLKLGREAAA